jgi:hypothetical protein
VLINILLGCTVLYFDPLLYIIALEDYSEIVILLNMHAVSWPLRAWTFFVPSPAATV